jgi:BirA family biotin operon repressor/biotin-[acetyl-CoA-carboxylase] ligase
VSTHFGEPLHHFEETDSTNERARELALGGAPSGTVVTAASQTAGRGRLDVCEACEVLAPVQCKIKWPNDIWLDERKLGGVLIEARPPDWAVIGVGVNLSIEPEEFPADLRWPAISLGHGVDPEQLRVHLDDRLGHWVDADPAEVVATFKQRDALSGRPIAWEGGPEALDRQGTAESIDEKGNLIVTGKSGEQVTLGSGEVTLQLL